MTETRWITPATAAKRADYTVDYFTRTLCFSGEGRRPFTIREFPTPGGRRRIQVHEPSFEAWLKSLERG